MGSTTVISTRVRRRDRATSVRSDPAAERRDLDPGGERAVEPAADRLAGRCSRRTRSRAANQVITVRVRTKDTRGFVVRDALVFVRSTPRVTTGGDRQVTTTDGWVTYQLAPNGNFPQPRRGFNVQFFVKAYRSGDPGLGGNRRIPPRPGAAGGLRSPAVESTLRPGREAAGFRDLGDRVSALADTRSCGIRARPEPLECGPARVRRRALVLVRLDVQVLPAHGTEAGAVRRGRGSARGARARRRRGPRRRAGDGRPRRSRSAARRPPARRSRGTRAPRTRASTSANPRQRMHGAGEVGLRAACRTPSRPTPARSRARPESSPGSLVALSAEHERLELDVERLACAPRRAAAGASSDRREVMA